ncbi:MAG TPA: BON domain-containing protein [Polyangiaceae bacterium]|nr:BON domain-containing protein [Polyangiaceae bacterium]
MQLRFRFRTFRQWGTIGLTTGLCFCLVAEPGARAEVGDGRDETVGRAVLQELERDPHLAAAGVTVGAHSGIVTLGGSLPLTSWRDRAERLARVADGVRAVINRIQVTPVRRKDADIAGDVRRRLADSAALSRLPIRVSVSRGVVELNGTITSWDEQQLAERVAAGVPGVRFCQNQLTASPPMPRTDAIIAADIRSRLDWDPLVEHDPIRVYVHAARAELSGTVGSQAEAARARSLASVKGVSTVDAGRLVVDSTNRPNRNVRSRWPRDDEISAAIEELARESPGVPMTAVTVAVLDGVVTLRGSVPTLGDAAAAQQLVRSAVGVVKVDDQLRGPWWRPPASPPPAIRRRPTRR